MNTVCLCVCVSIFITVTTSNLYATTFAGSKKPLSSYCDVVSACVCAFVGWLLPLYPNLHLALQHSDAEITLGGRCRGRATCCCSATDRKERERERERNSLAEIKASARACISSYGTQNFL